MVTRTLVFLFLVCLLAGCGSGGEPHVDRHGLVTYRIPLGWEAVPGSMETRFRPAEGGIRAEIQVSTILIDEPRDLQAERDQWLDFQKKQGNRILLSIGYTDNGFKGVAYAHETRTSMGDSIQHHVQMQRPGVLVATYLMAPEEHYEDFLPDYKFVLDSILPAK
jgi:hypothetical protein